MICEVHTDPFILGAINAWGDVFAKTAHDDQAQHPQEWRAYKTWRFIPDIGLLMWWESPDDGEKMTVEDWLDRKGYEVRLRSVMGQKIRVREVIKSLKGTTIKRYKNNVGKQVGPQLYVHKKYANEVIPHEQLKRAAEILKQVKPGFHFNSVMWNSETEEIRFDEAPDFDTTREPHVGKYITVYPNGSTREGQSNNIWHHKWLWVKDDYKGFDVDKAKQWSTMWLSKLPQIAKGTDKTFNAQLQQHGISETKIHGHNFPMIVYHGGGMEAKKPVIFMTRHLNVAKSYADDRNWGDRKGGKVHKFELTIRKPAGNEVVDNIGKTLGIEGMNHPEESSHEYLSPEMVGYENVQRVVNELKKLGYDSAWVDGDFSMDSDFAEYDSFVIWDGSQLKPLGTVDQSEEGPMNLKELLMNEASQDEAALDFLKKMVQSGPFKGQVYLAGGAVRDMVMGKIPKDLDVVVTNHGETGGMDFARWLAQQMGNFKEGSNPVLFPTFGTAKVVLTGEHNGVNLDGFDVEAVFARKETYTPGSRKPQVSVGTIEDDAFRRDFTANSLMLNLTTGEMLDITGKGKQDIAAGIIRTTSNPDEIFGQDALRMFRAIRFASKYNWKIDPETWDGIKNNLQLLVTNNTSKERIADELGKMLTHSNPDLAMALLRDTGLLPYLGKEFQQMVGMTQNQYHVDTVFDHTVQVLKNTRPDLLERLIALFHDIGKVVTRTVTPKGVQFIGHENEGPAIAEKIMRDLKYPVELINAVKLGVAEHMKLKHGGDDAVGLSDATLRKFKIKLGKNLETILRVIHADNMAHAPDSQMPNQAANVIKKIMSLNIPEAPELPYDGNEIMKRFGVSGEAVGILQDMLVNVWYKKGRLSDHDADAVIKGVMKELPRLIQKKRDKKKLK